MKPLITILTTILITASVFAQSPEKMSYQAVIRNSNDALVSNTQVGVKISILQGTATGTAVYAETQAPTTNLNGLVSLEIGTGTVLTGTFAVIDWANGPYFMKTETDPTGGSNYTISGTSQLLSVPYALHAKKSSGIAPNSELILTDTQANSKLYITPPGSGGSTGGIGTSTNHGVYFFTNNVDRAVFTPNGRFGFGTLNPTSMFHLADPNSEIKIENTSENSSLHLTAPGLGSTGGIGTSTNHGLYFYTNNVDRAVFTPNGKFGFGTLNPTSTVTVGGGDINILDIGAGVVIKSPNGNCWRVTVDNSGALISTAIACP